MCSIYSYTGRSSTLSHKCMPTAATTAAFRRPWPHQTMLQKRSTIFAAGAISRRHELPYSRDCQGVIAKALHKACQQNALPGLAQPCSCSHLLLPCSYKLLMHDPAKQNALAGRLARLQAFGALAGCMQTSSTLSCR